MVKYKPQKCINYRCYDNNQTEENGCMRYGEWYDLGKVCGRQVLKKKEVE